MEKKRYSSLFNCSKQSQVVAANIHRKYQQSNWTGLITWIDLKIQFTGQESKPWLNNETIVLLPIWNNSIAQFLYILLPNQESMMLVS